ncbi:MAG: hypothetical protein ACK56W_07185 [Pirellula sp.]|nr:hypothetical protein [Pirellula sp.]
MKTHNQELASEGPTIPQNPSLTRRVGMGWGGSDESLLCGLKFMGIQQPQCRCDRYIAIMSKKAA